MSKSRSHRYKQYKHRKKRYAHHWTRVFYLQIVAYIVVFALWVLPIPNPVKLLAVTFHEVSHAMAALLSGGRVFGYAIAPGGAGITLGIGGNMPFILLAGHIGSCIWGVLIYYMSVRLRPVVCILCLEGLMIASILFGWLNEYTSFFGYGALFMMMVVAFFSDPVRLFFVRVVGSACCLYAPFDVLSELFSFNKAPSVMGVETVSDIGQLAALSGIPVFLVGLFVIAGQVAVLVWLIRFTCEHGAKQAVRQEAMEDKQQRQRLREIRAITSSHKID